MIKPWKDLMNHSVPHIMFIHDLVVFTKQSRDISSLISANLEYDNALMRWDKITKTKIL
jgi:hypothetical protein